MKAEGFNANQQGSVKCSHVAGQVSPRLSGEEEVSVDADQTFCISAGFVRLGLQFCFCLFLLCERSFPHFHSLTLFKVFHVTFCRGISCVLPCLLPPSLPAPLRRPAPRSVYRFPAGLATHTQHASPLGSGHILPPAVRPRRLPSPSPPPRPQTGGKAGGWVGGWMRRQGRRVMTEVSAWVTVILSVVVPTGPGKSMHSSPVLRLHQSALLCSQDSHSCPSRAPTVRPSRGSSYTGAVMGKKSV